MTVWVDGQAYYGLDGHTIGRDASASITVDHAQVSRNHAALQFDGAGWAIRDLGSMNGLHDLLGRHKLVRLPAGRTQVWLGPPESSPCLYFDVAGPGNDPSEAGPYQPSAHDYSPQSPAGPHQGPPSSGAYPSVGQRPVPPPPPQPFGQLSADHLSAGGATPASGQAPVQRRQAPPPPPSGQFAAGEATSGPAPVQQRSIPPPPPSGSYPAGVSTPTGEARTAGQTVAEGTRPPVRLNTTGLEDNVGQLSQIINPTDSQLLIGRATECDISIPDPLVSRRHARLYLNESGGRIVDLSSDNGTFVNGQRIVDCPVAEGDLIEMGKAQFVLSEGRLQQHVAHGLPLHADKLSVTVGKGLVLLSDVSFALPAGSMTAVIGPSGCGKSTLLNALTGRRPANEGRVLLGGRDLYASDEGLGRRIGFVPQDDPVHESLTVRHALTAAAKLRLPSDTSTAEIKSDVEQVAGELGLAERLDTRIMALSGGQRKRVSVGYELVGAPQALILDEPTSGLDPGLERDLMSSLRDLADKGTTTIVVTHSVQSVQLCDLVLVLAPGGRLAFIGPPDKVAAHFNCPDLASVFTLLGTRQRADWEREFASTTSYLKFGAPAPISTSAPSIPLPPRSFSADLRVMLVRYVRTVVGDRKRLVVLLVQAPVLGLLLSFVLFQGAFSPQVSTDRRQYLLATILVMVLLGGFNSVREIVQDREVFRREVAVGVSAYGFVLSRWLVLGVTAVMQAVVLHLTASLRQLDSPGSGALLASGSLELMLALAGIGVVSVGIGLLISATVSDTAKALTALPLVILATLLLSGLVVPTSGRVGIQEVTYLNPVQWGSSAAAVSVDLRASTGCPPSLAGVDVPDELPGGEACTNDRWERSASTQAINFAGLVGWSLLLLFLAGFASRWTMGRPLRRS